MTDDGFVLAAPQVSPPVGSEFVYPQSTPAWTEPRCAVASRDNATFVGMQQPCWRNLVHKACNQGARGPPASAAAAGHETDPKGSHDASGAS